MSATLRVGALLDQLGTLLELDRVPGTHGLDRMVTGADVSSPGLALAGFVARFASERLQVFGELKDRVVRAAVPVPLAVVERHDARTGLDQSPSHQQALWYSRRTVVVDEDLGISRAIPSHNAWILPR